MPICMARRLEKLGSTTASLNCAKVSTELSVADRRSFSNRDYSGTSTGYSETPSYIYLNLNVTKNDTTTHSRDR
jgi:hypothetical protein